MPVSVPVSFPVSLSVFLSVSLSASVSVSVFVSVLNYKLTQPVVTFCSFLKQKRLFIVILQQLRQWCQ